MQALMTLWRRFVWNDRALIAMLWVSPAILTAIGSFLMSMSLGKDISSLESRMNGYMRTSFELERVTTDVERLQLDRATALLILTGQNSDQRLRYAADQLYRLSAQKSMRRIMATLYPSDWQQRMERHGELVAKGYDDKAAVDELQEFESGLIADASKELTRLQGAYNEAAQRRDRLDNWRSAIQAIGYYLIQILTILIFFWKTEAGGRK